MKNWFQGSAFWQLLIVIVLGFAVYSGTFHGPFLADDGGYIADNPIIKDNNYFQHPMKARNSVIERNANLKQHWPSRYFTFLSFRVNHALGGVNVTGYHAVNLLIHLLNACVLYALCAMTLRTPIFRNADDAEDGRQSKALRFVPLMVSLLFVSHPVQSNAVTYITQRFASLSAFFYLSSLLGYAFARLYTGKDSRGYIAYGVCMLAAGTGFFTKETVYTLPLALVLYELVFFKGPRVRRILKSAPVWMLAVAGLLILQWIKPVSISLTSATDIYSRTEYAATSLRVMLTYIRLLFFPVELRFYYDYPVYSSFAEPVVIASAVCVTGMLAGAAWLMAQTDRPAYRAAGFGVLWFFLALSIESSVFPLADMIFEHRLYLPMAGAAIALCFGVAGMAQDRPAFLVRLLPWGALSIALVLGAATYERNKTWMDPFEFLEDNLRKAPYKGTVHSEYGRALLAKGDINGAIREFKRSIELDRTYRPSYLNLGAAYGRLGQYDAALEAYLTAVFAFPDDPDAAYGLAVAYTKKEMYPEAAREFRRTLALSPEDQDAIVALNSVEQAMRMQN